MEILINGSSRNSLENSVAMSWLMTPIPGTVYVNSQR
jgi:hypothetical protein